MITRSPAVASILVLALVLGSETVVSAQPSPRSLADYVNAALSDNQLVRAAEADRAAAAFSGSAIRLSYLPQIGIASHVIVAPGYDEAVTNGGELGAQLTASYTLYDGGARGLEVAKGELGGEIGTAAWRQTRADVVYTVSIAYVRAVLRQRQVFVLRDDFDELRNYLLLVRELHASGRAGETDVLKTEVRMNNAAIELESRQGDFRNALLDLAQAAGLPAGEVIEVDTSAMLLSPDTTLRIDEGVDLEAASLAQRSAELEARVAAAQRSPTVAVTADAGALTSLPNLREYRPRVFGASLGLSVTLPLFTYGALEDRYQSAEEAARGMTARNAYLRSQLMGRFAAAKNSYDRGVRRLRALESNLAIADQNLALSRAQYFGGAGTSLDVLDAIQLVNATRLSLEETRTALEENMLEMQRLNTRREADL